MVARPTHLLEAGLVTEQRFVALQGAPALLAPHVVQRIAVDKRVRVPFVPRDRWLTAAREACRTLSEAVATSLRAGAVPLVLGGECTLIAGALPGALTVEPDLGLVYFDAHGDFNTLATTPTHHVGGMCLAHVCGHRVAPLLWPGTRSIAEERVALVGARALDPGEAGNLARSRVTKIGFDRADGNVAAIVSFAKRRPVWVHVDLDVVDPSEMPAVAMPADGGPRLDQLVDVLGALASVTSVRGVSVCGYDPRRDDTGQLVTRVADVALAALGRVPARAS